ncbi:hypothetical protein [Thermus tengchongensis]|uniref:hypothetical protein n=1 Tax=Thermus tengchongensis TaxID=1214928 RepID=UPI000AB6E8A8|nr:hypothetical protein [Thermus tengchongensis]
MTDLVVEVGGRTLLFTVRIGPGEYPRRYQVLLKRTQGGTYVPLSQTPSTPTAGPAQSSSPAPSPTPSPQVQAPAVHFTTTVEAPSGEEGRVSVFFTLENRGSRPVSFALNDLQILQEGKPLRFEVRRDPLKAVLNPGEGQSGVIVVHGARPGELLLRWRGWSSGPGGASSWRGGFWARPSRSRRKGGRMDLLAPWREGPYTLQEALERYGEALVGEALRQRVLKPVMTRLGPVLVPAAKGRKRLGLTRYYTPRAGALEMALLVRRHAEAMEREGWRMLRREGSRAVLEREGSGCSWWGRGGPHQEARSQGRAGGLRRAGDRSDARGA